MTELQGRKENTAPQPCRSRRSRSRPCEVGTVQLVRLACGMARHWRAAIVVSKPAVC